MKMHPGAGAERRIRGVAASSRANPKRFRQAAMQPVGDEQQTVVSKCFADERNAEGQAIGLESRRHSYGGEIEQIDKVCIIAEIGVQLNGRGLHLLDGVMRWRSGQQQKVRLLPNRGGFAPQCFQRVGRFECVHGTELLRRE